MTRRSVVAALLLVAPLVLLSDIELSGIEVARAASTAAPVASTAAPSAPSQTVVTPPTTLMPIPVEVTTPVKLSDNKPFYENPILALVLGAVLAYGASSLQSRQQRLHEMNQRAEDRARQAAYAQADGLILRFEQQFAEARQRAASTSSSARTFAVLAALLDEGGSPAPAIAGLPLFPDSLQDPDLRIQVEQIAELLEQYRNGQPVVRDHVLARLRDIVPRLVSDIADEAAAAEADVAALDTTGRATTLNDADRVRRTLIAPPR